MRGEPARRRPRLGLPERARATAAGLGAAAALLWIACSAGDAPPPSPAASTSASPPGPRATHAAELADLQRRLEAAERLAGAAPRSWLRKIELAELLLDRAQLAPRFDDLDEADLLVREAVELAPRAPVASLAKARVDLALHRFDAATEALDLPERSAARDRDAVALAAILSLRGTMAIERGDLAEAESLLLAAADLSRTYDALARQSDLAAKTCRFEEALELLEEAEGTLPRHAPRAHAWLRLQAGLVELRRGRVADALARFREAQAAYPSWWLVDEHVAEALSLEGEHAEAVAIYRQVVESTGDPELMGALSAVLAATDRDAAARWRDRATAEYEARIARFPDAFAGHAVEHFLEIDPARALELATRDARARPGAEARTRLAQALLLAGRLDEAAAQLDAVRAGGWCDAEISATAAVVAEHRGARGEAAHHAAKARAISLLADDRMADLRRRARAGRR